MVKKAKNLNETDNLNNSNDDISQDDELNFDDKVNNLNENENIKLDRQQQDYVDEIEELNKADEKIENEIKEELMQVPSYIIRMFKQIAPNQPRPTVGVVCVDCEYATWDLIGEKILNNTSTVKQNNEASKSLVCYCNKKYEKTWEVITNDSNTYVNERLYCDGNESPYQLAEKAKLIKLLDEKEKKINEIKAKKGKK